MLNKLFTTIGNAIRARNSYHNIVFELSQLTDNDLNTLGISRSTIHQVAAESAVNRLNIETNKDI